ncbi:hypothetical protein J6590_069741 [Homalodisca vitripennis]|nr:hypothetical protein J6590_069741 [Homalodisca vitripennis]
MLYIQVVLSLSPNSVKAQFRMKEKISRDHCLQANRSLTLTVVLSLSPNSVKAQFRSGGEDITRPLSSGKQEFDTDSTRPPLYQPFPKLESLILCCIFR